MSIRPRDVTKKTMGSQNPENSSDAAERPQDSAPSRAEIEALAYQIWEKEGRPEGYGAEHWRQAESLLQAQRLRAG